MIADLVTYFNNYEGLIKWFYQTYGNMSSYIDEHDVRSIVYEGIWRGYVKKSSDSCEVRIAKTVKNSLRDFVIYHAREKRYNYNDVSFETCEFLVPIVELEENFLLLKADIDRCVADLPGIRKLIAQDWLHYNLTAQEISKKYVVWVTTVYYHLHAIRKYLALRLKVYASN